MVGCETGEVGVVPNGLYSGVRFLDIPERGRPVPMTQIRPLHVTGVSARHLSEVERTLRQAPDAPPSLSTRTSDEDAGGQDFCRVEARRTEAGQTGGASQRVDFRGDVETRRRDSLRETRTGNI